MADTIDIRYFTLFEHVTKVTQSERGILAEIDGELLRVDVIRDDIMRIKISRNGTFEEEPTFAVQADLSTTDAEFTVEEGGAAVSVRTARMVLTLWKEPFHLEAHRADGSTIFETLQDEEGRYWTYAKLNNTFLVRRKCRGEDAFFGLGEKSGHLNRKGRDFILWNNDVLDPNSSAIYTAGRAPDDPRADKMSVEYDPYYVSIPFFYHLTDPGQLASGIFVDNGYRGYFDFTPSESYSFAFDGGQYTEYVFAGPGMREILEEYTWLTGRMLPPPLWSLGYHQCRWMKYDQKALEQIAARLREDHIPCDALWLDIDYMDGYRVFTWNKESFPDVPGMLERLSSLGFRVITIIDPGVKYEPGYRVFDQAIERDVLCRTEGGDIYIGQVWPGKTAFPDFVTQEARDWWGGLNADHVKSGLAGIWNDMNEPATGDIPPYAMRFDHGRYPHERFHNQYAMLMAMGTTDGLLRAMPDRRTFVLSRAGFAGIQRYAANWMGDNMSRWDHLWLSMPMALGFGLSGQPFVGADIGGFAQNTNTELFLRWVQCGTLTPFCRNHNETGNTDQYVWSYGAVIEELCRQAIQLRYRLMPYIYSAFMDSAETGRPVQTPLVLEFQDDRTLRDIDDEYLFGSQLLVAPVYEPGVTSRPVYLPEGTWYQWHTDEQLSGKRFIVAHTPMDYIPIYARGGSVIPMWPEAPRSTDGYHPETIELHIFLPEDNGEYRSFLHEDDGLTFGFRQGAYYRTSFTLTKTVNHLTLNASVSGEGYPEFARKAFRLVFHGGTPKNVQVDGKQVEAQDGLLTVSNAGTGFELTADFD